MSVAATVAVVTKAIAGAKITVTRPNNVTAYSAAGGQVWGDGVDARIAIPVPAQPSDAVELGFTVSIYAILGRPIADAITTFFGAVYSSQPATVLKDQDTFAVSDADIALMAFGSGQGSAFSTSSTTTTASLNAAAGVNGRRIIGSGNNMALITGEKFIGGSTVYMYLRTAGAYTPVALEQMFLTPVWTYQARQ